MQVQKTTAKCPHCEHDGLPHTTSVVLYDGDAWAFWSLAVALTLLAFGSWCSYKHLTTPDKVNYCKVSGGDPVSIVGVRDWHVNTTLWLWRAGTPTPEEVAKTATTLGCPLNP